MNTKKFIVTPKNDNTTAISIRISETIYNNLKELSKKSKRSYNELVNMALEYSFNNLDFTEDNNNLN